LHAAVEEAANARQIAPAMIAQLAVVTALYLAASLSVALVLGPSLHNSQEALLDTVGKAFPQFPLLAFELISSLMVSTPRLEFIWRYSVWSWVWPAMANCQKFSRSFRDPH